MAGANLCGISQPKSLSRGRTRRLIELAWSRVAGGKRMDQRTVLHPAGRRAKQLPMPGGPADRHLPTVSRCSTCHSDDQGPKCVEIYRISVLAAEIPLRRSANAPKIADPSSDSEHVLEGAMQ
jgi:hypothetical protein